MSYLAYISDGDLMDVVKEILDIGRSSKENAKSNFTSNVIDPFAPLFEASSFSFNHEEWVNSETARQSQKTVQNHVGTLHQRILGQVNDWENLGIGGIVDIVCESQKIIAEIKNKYNTVTGGKLSDQYYLLEKLVTMKTSRYYGYTAYFASIIPRRPVRYNSSFTPSDKEKGAKCPLNEKIRKIDGFSFYELVTGRENSLYELYSALPNVIEQIYRKDYKDSDYIIPDKSIFEKYFFLAYGDSFK